MTTQSRSAIEQAIAYLANEQHGEAVEIRHKLQDVLNEDSSATITISNERRFDMLAGALEGGSNYWYHVNEENYTLIGSVQPPNGQLSFAERMWATILAGKTVEIHDREDEENKVGEINLESIARGERKMMEKSLKHFTDIISESDDSITADVWFQYVVMNDLVYG